MKKKTKKQKKNWTKKYLGDLESPALFRWLLAFLAVVLTVCTFFAWKMGWQIAGEEYVTEKAPGELKPWQKEIREMTAGYPIEKMVPYILRKDQKTAAFIVGVAKKESDWGNHVPVLNGEDCYNYWGYRGEGERMTVDGYTCFRSPKEAVNAVAKRFSYLATVEKLDTPREMVVWKCGRDCAGHAPDSVSKWISDVGYYFEKICRP